MYVYTWIDVHGKTGQPTIHYDCLNANNPLRLLGICMNAKKNKKN
jgi:hypothetical protein